ncbi:hypothetical protein PHYPSEUDO_012017 [Phytophthora pseudosyringae]|uniref:Uncharacterized protein n=1 Tax=Phytophthora pseudosyringae TaxID=221518 RepID=A0A8T1VAA1_9STRA|nr:hypothetical protein PHYPSEUDO_012017 [Phytophthora pseudosyringae]
MDGHVRPPHRLERTAPPQATQQCMRLPNAGDALPVAFAPQRSLSAAYYTHSHTLEGAGGLLDEHATQQRRTRSSADWMMKASLRASPSNSQLGFVEHR